MLVNLLNKNKMNNVVIRVIPARKGGYQLEHNQHHGFKGIITNRWAWFKYKSDAERSAIELMKCWNTK